MLTGKIKESVAITVWNLSFFAVPDFTAGRLSKAPVYLNPTSFDPLATFNSFAFTPANTLSFVFFATQYFFRLTSISEYSVSPSITSAIFAGTVHGVVVQASKYSSVWPTIGKDRKTDS